jgi:hypothetical protein
VSSWIRAVAVACAAICALPVTAATTITISPVPQAPPGPNVPVVAPPVGAPGPANPSPGVWVDVDPFVGFILVNNTGRRWWDLHFLFAQASFGGIIIDDRTNAFMGRNCDSVATCSVIAKPPAFPGLPPGATRYVRLLPMGDPPPTVRVNIWGSVPEPQLWATMITGLSLAGLSLRRERRRRARSEGPAPGRAATIPAA